MSDPLWSYVREVTRGEIRARRTVAPAVILGRDTDGRVRVRMAEGQCAVAGGRLTQGPGDIALVSPTSGVLRREQGTAGAGFAESTSTAPPILFVESIDPDTFEQGFTGTVTVTGRGFLPTTTFQFLLEDGAGGLIPHPGIAITAAEVLDAETAELEITVGAEAEIVEEAPLGYA